MQWQLGSCSAGTRPALVSPSGTPSPWLQLWSPVLQDDINSLGQGLSYPAFYMSPNKEPCHPHHLVTRLQKGSADEKELPKVSCAWLLGFLSQDFPISCPHYPLTNGFQGTDAEIRTTGKLVLSSMSKPWKFLDRYMALLMLKEANPN